MDELLTGLAAEAAAILARWPDHEKQCNSYYCGQQCDFVDEMGAREGVLLERLAALLPAAPL